MRDGFVRSMDVSSKGAKLFLALPILDLSWGFYRIVQSLKSMKTAHVILAALLFGLGIPFMWLVDFISICSKGEIIWFHYYKEDTLIEQIKATREMKKKAAEEEAKKSEADKQKIL